MMTDNILTLRNIGILTLKILIVFFYIFLKETINEIKYIIVNKKDSLDQRLPFSSFNNNKNLLPTTKSEKKLS